MEQSNKELIKEIADLFEDYEESYVPGEWEAFQQHQKKKYPFFSQWIKVAAVLFLIVSVVLFNLKDLNEKKAAGTPVAKNKPAVSVPHDPVKVNGAIEKDKAAAQVKHTTAGSVIPVETVIPAGTAGHSGKILNKGSLYAQRGAGQAADRVPAGAVMADRNKVSAPPGEPSGIQIKDHALTQAKDQAVTQVNVNTSLPAQPVQQSAKKDTVTIPEKRKISTAEFMLAETRKAGTKEVKKESGSKWDFGVQVMPTATRTNVNFGGGLVTAYRISNKFSLSSGISLLQLGSGENTPGAASGGGAAQASPNASEANYSFSSAAASRQLRSVDATLKAIDIPLGLVYKMNKHYYTSAGVSYFNVLSERRNNTYSQVQSVSRTATDPATGQNIVLRTLETQEVDESVPDQPLKGNSYLGFFNFSIGRRQNIFKQYNIQIEPFIKVPIGKLSGQDLNLMNSGVKFQLSF
ncbi:hypothetical protein [Pedobacter hartonius]|uniref:Outer membrane protein beta-barrel domain-containing protein n=1 Tax=Pedobacter hartonius TaxID=425514 RepID=A0A1H4AQF4_9SPHI|nr:hypothetical protein [Pedobacter hartonius]SEA37952.1 hypothetical protein SAMN05443550_10357 [Pedobacter hartonius]